MNKELEANVFNSLVYRIKQDINWIDEFIDLLKYYYKDEKHINGGSLHIVLEDDNIDNNSITWCAGYACGSGDYIGNDIASLMMWMTKKQRELVIKNYNLYSI